jgi:F0F1-type ATP synthase epsilon subunit
LIKSGAVWYDGYMAQLLHVRVNSPEKLIWEGDALSVSSKNADGPFDILPFHSNFITFIEKQPIRVNTGKNVESYTFDYSVIYAHINSVMIYTNI